jgi:hypothetical protein
MDVLKTRRPSMVLGEIVAIIGMAVGGAQAQLPQVYQQTPPKPQPVAPTVQQVDPSTLNGQEVYIMVHQPPQGRNDTYMEGFNSAQREYRPAPIQPRLPIWRNGAEYAWIQAYANYFTEMAPETAQFAALIRPTRDKSPYQNGRDAGAAYRYLENVAPRLNQLLLSMPLQQMETQHAFTGKGAAEAMARCQVPNTSGLPQYAPDNETRHNPIAIYLRMEDTADNMANFAACLRGTVNGPGFNLGSHIRIGTGPTVGPNWTNAIANIAQQTAQQVEANRSTMQNFINYLPPAFQTPGLTRPAPTGPTPEQNRF